MERVKKELMERGAIFERLGGVHFKHYTGIAEGEGFLGAIKHTVGVYPYVRWHKCVNSHKSIAKS